MRKTLTIAAKSTLALLSVAGVGLLIFAGWLIWHYEYAIGLPDKGRLATVSAMEHICSAGDRRTYVPLAEIPLLIRRAVLAYEEPDFYERTSINPLTDIILALILNRSPRSRSGAISGSVTRCLTHLSPRCCKGIDWHIGNLVLMDRVERTLSRDLILEIYLNENYVGRGSYGVAAASASYFGKPLADLNVDEIAFIATLLRTPSPRKGFEIAQRNRAIDRMLRAGVVSPDQAASAMELPLELREWPPGAQIKPDRL